MNSCYQFENDILIIRESALGIFIESSFKPKRLPDNPESDPECVKVYDGEGALIRAYYEKHGSVHGMMRHYFPTKEVQGEMFYYYGLLHGPSKFFSRTGNLLSIAWYFRGKREGRAWRYYESGAEYACEQYSQNLLEGVQRYFYEDGTLKTELEYSEGRLVNTASLYWPNGQLKRQTQYAKGLRDGREVLFNEVGEVLIDETFEMGDLVTQKPLKKEEKSHVS